MKTGIAAAGNWIVDRVKIVDHWPEQDTLANILGETIGNGGGAFNVLTDLAKLGAYFPLDGVGLVGDDAEGEWIMQTCQRNGIGTDQLKTAAAPTSYTDVITAKDTGRRTFFHQRGANALFGPESFEISNLRSRIFYQGYALLLDGMDGPDAEFGTKGARVLAEASRQGMKTAMDVVSEDSGRFSSIVSAALPHLDWLFMNEFEAGRTVGRELTKDGELDAFAMEEAASELLDRGVRAAVFLHASSAALACTRAGDRVWLGAVELPDSEISGTVGAGDAFAAGVLLGLHEGEPPGRCLEFGVCAAAATLRHPSASDGLLPLTECLQLGATYGFRRIP